MTDSNLGAAAAVGVLYLVPAIVAGLRRHRHASAIGLLNILLGWTVLGWIVALVWAAMDQVRPEPARPGPKLNASASTEDPRQSLTLWRYILLLIPFGIVAALVFLLSEKDRAPVPPTNPPANGQVSLKHNTAVETNNEKERGTLREPAVTAIPRTEQVPAPVVPQSTSIIMGRETWVTSDRLNRRTCPNVTCGIVGVFFFREQAIVYEEKDGWARVSKYYAASCSNGLSQYVDTGNAACLQSNGIVDDRLAEWVLLKYLSSVRPADPGADASGMYAIVSSSDDYRRYKDVFARTAGELIAAKRCDEKDFRGMGWLKSTNKADTPIYFVYCGGVDRDHRLYLNAATGEVFE